MIKSFFFIIYIKCLKAELWNDSFVCKLYKIKRKTFCFDYNEGNFVTKEFKFKEMLKLCREQENFLNYHGNS